jgi:formylglycine-generating enzyme required for sulfatase activity
MLKASRSQRAVLTGALAVACAVACDTVLDIQDPTMRPSGGGQAGEQTGGAPSVAGSHDASGMPGAGEAGTPSDIGGMGGTETTSGNAGEAGQAGAGGARDCTPDEARCAGAAEKSPEICDASGHWIPNPDEANDDCPVLCAAGKCTVCKDGDKRCSVCEEGDANCSTNQAQKCVDGAWADDGDACKHYCDAGSCKTPTSCSPSAGQRGVCTGGESCCLSPLVPGGSFNRDYDGGDYFNDPGFPAKISSFYLDKFEVTVGRMRQFVDAYAQLKLNLKDGDGKSAHIASDVGWSTSYTLPANPTALTDSFKCSNGTWSDTVGDNDQLPINCVNFNVAYAFCIWDGGRLPTESEWDFAGAGGDQYRVYPWKAPQTTPADWSEYAAYGALNGLPGSVGAKPLGNARWGQADMAGNVAEWMLDYYQDYSRDVCDDCLNLTSSFGRSVRGGSYLEGSSDALFVAYRIYGDPSAPDATNGFRCARDLQL